MADVDDEDFSASRETVEGEESDEEIEVTAAEVLERLEEVKLESFWDAHCVMIERVTWESGEGEECGIKGCTALGRFVHARSVHIV